MIFWISMSIYIDKFPVLYDMNAILKIHHGDEGF